MPNICTQRLVALPGHKQVDPMWERAKGCALLTKNMANLEFLPLKHLQPGHGDLQGFSVIILQQVLHATAHKVEALGPSCFQRPGTNSFVFR